MCGQSLSCGGRGQTHSVAHMGTGTRPRLGTHGACKAFLLCSHQGQATCEALGSTASGLRSLTANSLSWEIQLQSEPAVTASRAHHTGATGVFWALNTKTKPGQRALCVASSSRGCAVSVRETPGCCSVSSASLLEGAPVRQQCSAGLHI